MDNTATVIKMLEEQFNCECRQASEFTGIKDSVGIWVRNIGKVDDNPAFDSSASEYDHNEHIFTMGVNNIVEEALTNSGWFAEPYDSETWMIYPF